MNTEDIIEKLSRLTVARGATEAEAKLAQEKIAQIRARGATEAEAKLAQEKIAQIRARCDTETRANYKSNVFVKVPRYVEGWPGQVTCPHKHSSPYNRMGIYVCSDCGHAFVPVFTEYCGHSVSERVTVGGRVYCKVCGRGVG